MRRVPLALLLMACSSGSEPGDPGVQVQDLPFEAAVVDSVRLVHLSPVSSGTCNVIETDAGPIRLSGLETKADVRAYLYWSYTDQRAGTPYRDCSTTLAISLEPGPLVNISLTQTGPQTATIERVESGIDTARLIAAFGSDPVTGRADTLFVLQTQ
jgi:hypothetical protein